MAQWEAESDAWKEGEYWRGLAERSKFARLCEENPLVVLKAFLGNDENLESLTGT